MTSRSFVIPNAIQILQEGYPFHFRIHEKKPHLIRCNLLLNILLHGWLTPGIKNFRCEGVAAWYGTKILSVHVTVGSCVIDTPHTQTHTALTPNLSTGGISQGVF